MVSVRSLLADLVDAFPDRRIPEATVSVYERELADVPLDALEGAVRELIRVSDYFPRVAEVRRRAAARVHVLPSEADALAQVSARTAWTRLDERERPDTPPALHPLVKDALDLVGGAYAFKSSDNPSVVRGQFLNLYRESRARTLERVAVGDFRPALPSPGQTS